METFRRNGQLMDELAEEIPENLNRILSDVSHARIIVGRDISDAGISKQNKNVLRGRFFMPKF